MPTIMTHAAVPLAVGLGLGREAIPRRLLAAGVVFSMVPDLDVYAHLMPGGFLSGLGHRYASHSLVAALLCALFAALIARALQCRRITAFWFVGLSTASHGFLDAFTNGGSGIRFFWPLDPDGYFMPWRVIEVSPLGVVGFFSERGLSVIVSELTWVWPPAVALALLLYGLRRLRDARRSNARGRA